jgi:DNA-binding Lrp family transcriptional regulator
MENNQLSLFKVRDLRKKDQFKIDDLYLNGYARVCGVNATLVYLSLCRHAEFESQKAFPSQQKIAFELGISVASVKRGIKKLIEHKIIMIEKEKMDGKFDNNVYYLLDKSGWIKSTVAHTDTRLNHSSNTVAHTAIWHTDTQKDTNSLRITNIKDNKNKILVDYFFELKGWANKDKDFYKQNKIIYGHYAKSAKDLLTLCNQDLEVAKSRLKGMAKWAKANNLEWALETCIKRFYADNETADQKSSEALLAQYDKGNKYIESISK